MSVVDPVAVARDAGLRHVDPARFTLVRRRRGTGFDYVDADGRPVSSSDRDRIDDLAIPPAWEDVRIAADRTAHIQALGVDGAGRVQYRYHADFRAAADARKFARLSVVGRRLDRLRRELEDALDRRSVQEEHGDTPLVIALIDHTLLRVGSERYVRENGTFGASTLRVRHVTSRRPGLRLRFTAKGDVDRDITIDDRRLTRAVLRRRRQQASDPEAPLFAGPDGGSISGALVADRLERWTGIPMTAKELRTWGASATMIGALLDPKSSLPADATSSSDPLLAAYDEVGFVLGNTRDVARSSYVAPAVVDAWNDGELATLWRRSRSSHRFSRSEQVLRKLMC